MCNAKITMIKTMKTWVLRVAWLAVVTVGASVRGAEHPNTLNNSNHRILVQRLQGFDPTLAGVAWIPKLDPAQKGLDLALVARSRTSFGVLYVLDRADAAGKFSSFGTPDWSEAAVRAKVQQADAAALAASRQRQEEQWLQWQQERLETVSEVDETAPTIAASRHVKMRWVHVGCKSRR